MPQPSRCLPEHCVGSATCRASSLSWEGAGWQEALTQETSSTRGLCWADYGGQGSSRDVRVTPEGGVQFMGCSCLH